MKIKVYLDVCSWYRPFDDQSQSRIRMEAEAVDDKFQKNYDQLHDRIKVKVMNPIDFVKGVDI